MLNVKNCNSYISLFRDIGIGKLFFDNFLRHMIMNELFSKIINKIYQVSRVL